MDPVIIAAIAIGAVLVGTLFIVKIATRHKCKWGPVEEGYQTCTECGKTRTLGAKGCEHKWKTENVLVVSNCNNRQGKEVKTAEIHVLACEKCGDKKEFKTGV